MPSIGASMVVRRRSRSASSRAGEHLLDPGMVVDLDLGIAGERRLDPLQVLLQRRDTLARDLGTLRDLSTWRRARLAIGEVLLPFLSAWA